MEVPSGDERCRVYLPSEVPPTLEQEEDHTPAELSLDVRIRLLFWQKSVTVLFVAKTRLVSGSKRTLRLVSGRWKRMAPKYPPPLFGTPEESSFQHEDSRSLHFPRKLLAIPLPYDPRWPPTD